MLNRKVTPDPSLRTRDCALDEGPQSSKGSTRDIPVAKSELVFCGKMVEAGRIIAFSLGKVLVFCEMLCDTLRTGKEGIGT